MIHLAEAKIKTLVEAKAMLASWKATGQKVVFTNGCFDLVHAGHLHYLAEAKSLGHRLIIGLNSDASVSRLKGDHRPLIAQKDRALLLASLFFVDMVVIFEQDTPLELITGLAAVDVLVKGGDYAILEIVGAKEVMDKGGEVKVLSFLPGYSTSALEAKIKAQT